MLRRSLILTLAGLAALGASAWSQTPRQPKVAPGPDEPDWDVILKTRYGLSMFGDLLNPVRTSPESTPGLFRKAGRGRAGLPRSVPWASGRSPGAEGTPPPRPARLPGSIRSGRIG